jgi:hypothetical protein
VSSASCVQATVSENATTNTNNTYNDFRNIIILLSSIKEYYGRLKPSPMRLSMLQFVMGRVPMHWPPHGYWTS